MSKEVQNCRPITTCWSATCIWKTARASTNMQDHEILTKKVGDPGGQRCREDVCGQRLALVRRTPEMYSGGGVADEGGVAGSGCKRRGSGGCSS